MLKLTVSGQYKRDHKTILKRGWNVGILKTVLDVLLNEARNTDGVKCNAHNSEYSLIHKLIPPLNFFGRFIIARMLLTVNSVRTNFYCWRSFTTKYLSAMLNPQTTNAIATAAPLNKVA